MEHLNQKLSLARPTKAPLYMVLGVAAGISAFALMASLGQAERNQKAQKDDDMVSSAHSAAILSELRSMSESEQEELGASNEDFLNDLINYAGLYEGQNFNMDSPELREEQAQDAATEQAVLASAPPVESERDKAVKALQERRASALLKALSASSAVDSGFNHKVSFNGEAGGGYGTGGYGAGAGSRAGGHSYAEQAAASPVGPNGTQYLSDASARLAALRSGGAGGASGAGGSGSFDGGMGYSDGRTMDAYKSLSYRGSNFDTAMEAAANSLTLMQGSVVPCVLLTGVNSDIPGMVQAQVSADVYDSATGERVLIPKGSKLLGQYASGPMRGQERLMFGFNRLIFPNGRSMQLGAMPASSRDGYAGLGANVNNRFFEILGNAILLGGVTAGIALSVDDADRDDNGNLTLNGALNQGLGQSVGRVITQLIERNMNVAPTLTIKPGYEFNVTLSQDVTFAH